ncbi:MAG: hypothetical protein NT160_02895 [Actinobacteria bacterium]|nr:hypothetical protein [Actinomycetota bacterium]
MTAILAISGVAGNAIRSDGFGYYAYLPSMWLHHSTNLSLVKPFMPPGTDITRNFGIGLDAHSGHYVDKYPIGVSLLLTPYFLVAVALQSLSGGAVTGFSTIFQISVVCAAISFLCLGALACYLGARRFVSESVAFFVTLLVIFGTNVFYYGVFISSFSHVYSFAAVAWLLYVAIRLQESIGQRPWYRFCLLGGLLLGLVFDIRNTDLVVALLLLPGLLGERRWKDRIRGGLIISAGALLAALPQLLYVRAVTGSPFTNTYGVLPGPRGDYESFVGPQLIRFWFELFSPSNGIFLLTPMTLVAVLSLVFMAKRNRSLTLAIAGIIFNLCLFASWHAPFTTGFAIRPFANVASLFVLPLAVGVASLLARWPRQQTRTWVVMIVLAGLTVIWSGALAAVRMLQYQIPKRNFAEMLHELARLWTG